MALSGWSTTAASNATVGSIDWAEGMAPAQVNNSARQLMTDMADWYRNGAEWIARADSATYVSGTSFKFTGSNKTAIYTVGRRVKLVAATPGTLYGRITNSAFSTDTTVTVSWDSTSVLANEAITSVAPALYKGGTSGQSAYIGGLKGISTFSTTTVGSTTASAWRTALGLGSLATATTINNSNWSGTALAVGNGGTGSTSAGAARTALGLGSMATQSSTGVSITGGTITGITGVNLLKSYTSSQQTITAAGALTLAHSLSAIPSLVQFSLVCQTGEGGYTAGDIIRPIFPDYNNGRGASCVVDATNINIRFGDSSIWVIPHKTTGAAFSGTLTNWKLIVSAWA